MQAPDRTRTLALALAVFVCPLARGQAPVGPLQEQDAGSAREAADVLDRAWSLLGERVGELSTWQATGKVTIEGAEEGEFVDMIDRRGRVYSWTRVPGLGAVELGWDGRTVWERDERAGARIKKGADAAVRAAQDEAALVRPVARDLRGRAAHGRGGARRTNVLAHRADAAPRGCRGGARPERARVLRTRGGTSRACRRASLQEPRTPHPEESPVDVLYVDRESNRWQRLVMKVRSPSGAALSLATRFEDWREVDGVWFPFQRSVELGRTRLVRTVESLEVDAELPAGRLALPRAIAARLQLLEPESRVPRIEVAEPRHVASTRIQATPQEFGPLLLRTIRTVQAALRQRGIQPVGPPFARYHRMDTELVDLEIGFPVGQTIVGGDAFQAGVLPGGPVATIVHEGPLEALPETYVRLEKAITEQDHEIQGGQWEVYWTLLDPTVDPRASLVQIVVPVREVADGG